MKMPTLAGVFAVAAVALLASCASDQDSAEIEKMKQALAEVRKTKEIEKGNLDNFDDLDFNVFTGQKWDQLGKSHHKNIIVHWPDGRTTKGIDAHIEDLKAMFVYAPDTRIKEHPIKIASGNWTAVSGIIEGTFTRSMPVDGGKTIPPTGKAFKLSMVTIGHWKDGVMVEEWLMWDNLSFMRQIGLAQ